MKGKSLLIWLLVLAAAAAAWFLSGQAADKSEKAQAQANRLLNLSDPLDVRTVEMSGREVVKPIRIERREQEHRWQITRPVDWPADGGQVGRLIDSLLQAKGKDRHAAPGRLADFGLEPPAFHVILTDGGGAKAEALFGDLSPSKENFYAQVAGSKEVVFLPADVRGFLAKSLFDLREKRVVDVVAANVTGLKLRLGDKRLELARSGEGVQVSWEVTGLGRADPREADKLLFGLRGVMATSFHDEGINPERMGLNKPWGEIRLAMANGSEQGLLLGGPVPGGKPGQEERYLRRIEGGPVMTARQDSLERLALDPMEVLERRLLKLEREQITGLTIARDGKELRYEKKDRGFIRANPPGDEQAGEVAELFFFDLLNLRWDKTLAGAKPLDQPGAVITVTLAPIQGQAQTETLVLGPLTEQGPLEARVQGHQQGYLVPRDFAAKLPTPEGRAADQ